MLLDVCADSGGVRERTGGDFSPSGFMGLGRFSDPL